MIDVSQSVARLVLDHSECAEVFQRHRIDFCCRGDVSIETAAKERGLKTQVLIGELAQAIADRRGERDGDPRELSTAALIARIVSKHHAYLRKALPFVRPLATKVARVHGAHNPKLIPLDQVVGELSEALLTHLDEEEQELFPRLTADAGESAEAKRLLDAMLDEHLVVAALLERIHVASDDFRLPDWACNSYRTLFAELREIERDIFTHVHLENHVLKSRFSAA